MKENEVYVPFTMYNLQFVTRGTEGNHELHKFHEKKEIRGVCVLKEIRIIKIISSERVILILIRAICITTLFV